MASDLQGSTLSINGRAYRPIHATYLASLWAAQNPILQRGEIGVEQDTLLFKVGNGIDRWNSLEYATGEPGPQGPEGPEGEQGPQGDTGVSFSTTATIYNEENPLPTFSDTPVNTGYYYQRSNGIYDIYVHLEDEENWFVIENWGGIPGPQGIQGIQGVQGPQGEQGPQGIQGIQGIQGPAGQNALNFVTQPGIYSASNPLPSFATVEEGTAYLFQNANDTYSLYAKAFGANDWTIINNYGGTEGPQGPQGITGATGPYFTPSVNLDGEISWTNNGGLVNPETRSIKGPQGETGTPGAAATISVGIVTTGTPGSSVIVNNSGTSSAAVFDFTIPQGATGATGPQGPQGLVITNLNVDDTTGVILVTTSSSMNNAPVCKKLFGNSTVSGTWTGSGTSWTFTPNNSGEIIGSSWIITLQ